MTHAEQAVAQCGAGEGGFGTDSAVADPRHACRMAGHGGDALRRWYQALRCHVPTDCALCGGRSHGALLCAACEEVTCCSMRREAPRCQVCALLLEGRIDCPDCRALLQSCERIVAAFDYVPPGDELVRRFKTGRRFLLAPALAALMARAVRDRQLALPAHTVLVPVPARSASVLQRGFSPAAELARFLARELSMPCHAHRLQRVRDGERQTHRSRRQRLLAGQADFHCPETLDGVSVMVVDDVLTTGATLHRAAQSLRAAGAVQVFGAVLARTPWRAS